MDKTCSLPGGCPCLNTGCARFGVCHECIANHAAETADSLVACMREKAKLIYGAKEEVHS